MLNRLLHITMFLVLAATAGAQYLPGKLQGGSGVPGTQSRSPLNSLERAANNLPGITIVTDTFGNQRWSYYVRVLDTCVNYNPLLTVGNLPISSFVYQCGPNDSLFYIDWKSDVVLISIGGGPSCDADWLDIVTNDCPDNINDSIYTQKYAAIGARLVWPTAELLVSDSAAVQVTVLSGNRNSRLGFWDNVNEFGSTIDQSGAQTLWYIEPTGEMRWATAGSGTVQAPGAPFVNQFAINPSDSPLPTVQAHQYPNTRTDTATIRNFIYTDLNGKFRSQAIDTLIQVIVDSIAVDTALQYNWYTNDGTTTSKVRTATIDSAAIWQGDDPEGFLYWEMGSLTGGRLLVDTASAIYQSGLGGTNRVQADPQGIDITTSSTASRAVNITSDTVNMISSFDPTLMKVNLLSDGTYFSADSVKVVGIGQFPFFPSLAFDGTEKGYYSAPTGNGFTALVDGDGTTGGYSYMIVSQSNNLIEAITQPTPNSTTIARLSMTSVSANSLSQFVVENANARHSAVNTKAQASASASLHSSFLARKDTNLFVTSYLGESNSSTDPYTGRRAWGVRLIDTVGLNVRFDWIQSYLPNDTIENAISFYNRAYYWKNQMPTGVAGDTLFHFWAEDGTNAGKNPGFITLDQMCAHCAETAVNWYNSNGTTTDNTRIATVTETATWLSNDVTADGIYPFRFELSGGGANEPENMVWLFPAGDSATLSQSDQELILFSSNQWLFKSNEATTVQADSFQYNPNAGGTGFRVGDNNVITQNAPSGTPTHRDAIEYRTITGTAQTELFLDGGADIWVVPTNSASNFKIHVAAICSAAGNGVGINTGDAWASWHLGGIKRVGSTTSLIGSVQAAATAQSDAGMSTSVVTIDADDTDESLRIRFTPPNTAGTTTVIQVIATIEIAQTSY